MADAERYRLVEAGKNRILVSLTSCAILKALNLGDQFEYPELSKKTGVPLTTLYVFCQRLEKAKLLRRKKVLMKSHQQSGLLRVHTLVCRAGKVPLNFPPLKVIR